MGYLKTSAVADALGVGYYQLFDLLRTKKIAPPAKDSSGDYVWAPEDVERAHEALARSRRRRGIEGAVAC